MENKKLSNLLKVFIFYIASQFTVAIPITIFKINLDNTSTKVIALLNLFPGVVLSLFLFYFYRKDLKEQFKEFKIKYHNIIEEIIKYWGLGLILMMISNILISTFSPVKQAANEVGIREILNSSPVIALISIVIVAPFTEELLFRKSLKDFINNKYLFVIISGFIFGFMHVIGSYKNTYDLLFIIPYGVLGGAFALLYHKTDNIYAPIFAHFFHNTFVVTIILLTYLKVI